MAIEAASIITRLEAETSEFAARMSAAGASVERLTKTQVVAARGVEQLSVGMRGLAHEALGVSGPLGQTATGLLALTTGPAFLAITAGLAAYALALRVLAKSAREAERAEEAAERAWTERLARLAQIRQLGTEFVPEDRAAEVRSDIAQTEASLAELRAREQQMLSSVPAQLGQLSWAETSQLQEWKVDIVALTAALARLQLGLAELTATPLPNWEAVMAAARDARFRAVEPLVEAGAGERAAAQQRLLTAGEPIALRGGVPQLAGTEEANHRYLEQLAAAQALLTDLHDPMVEYNRQLALLDFAQTHLGLTTEEYTAAVTALDLRMRQGQKDALLLGIAIINAISAAIQFAQGGGIGGFLGAIGGLVGAGVPALGIAANPLAGLVLSGVGAIATTLESGNDRRYRAGESAQDRRHQELLGAFSAVGEAIIILGEGFDESNPQSADRMAVVLGQIESQRITIHRRGGALDGA